MPTSRTGTSKYLRNRAEVLRQAQADGLTHCPGYQLSNGAKHECGIELDYQTPRLPNSAETDHVVESQYGGTDDKTNLRVICATCNKQRNRKGEVPVAAIDDFPLSRAWL